MTQEAGTPPGFWEQIDKKIEARVAKAMRSGPLRNASISGGGLTIKGGFLRLRDTLDTLNAFYVGPVTPPQPDGTPQPGWIVRRADGTSVLALRDAFPVDGPDGVNQALTWYDRAGNVTLADDTNGGQGMARPHLSGGFGRARFADLSVSTTSGTFETLWTQRVTKQQPRLEVWYKASMDTAGETGEVRVLVNGVQLGATVAHEFFLLTAGVGPAAVAGAHMSTLTVEIQGRRTSAGGALRVEALSWYGRQS